jgi:hypothetical protein
MAVVVKELIPAKQAESIQTDQYTATGAKAIIDKFTVTNTSASNVFISVNLIEPAGSPGNANLIVKERTLAPSETYTCPELVGQVLDVGAKISTLAGAGTSLTIRCSGREIVG